MVPLALGSDTGGSIRQPAGLCGIVGFKPTYGRVSRYGLLAFASSLDQIGPLALTGGRRGAACFAVIGGFDPHDSTSSPEPMPDLSDALSGDVKGLRIGVPRAFLGEGVDQPTLDGVRVGAARARRRAARRSSTSSCRTPAYGIPVYYLIAPPRPRPTSRATTASATATAPSSGKTTRCRTCTSAPATKASAPK